MLKQQDQIQRYEETAKIRMFLKCLLEDKPIDALVLIQTMSPEELARSLAITAYTAVNNAETKMFKDICDYVAQAGGYLFYPRDIGELEELVERIKENYKTLFLYKSALVDIVVIASIENKMTKAIEIDVSEN